MWERLNETLREAFACCEEDNRDSVKLGVAGRGSHVHKLGWCSKGLVDINFSDQLSSAGDCNVFQVLDERSMFGNPAYLTLCIFI